MFKIGPSVYDYEADSQSDEDDKKHAKEKENVFREQGVKMYSDFKENLCKKVDETNNEHVLQNLVNSVNSFEQVKFSTLKNKSLKNEIKAMERKSDLAIKVWYKAQRKILDNIPRSFDELQQEVIKIVKSSRRNKLSTDDLIMYYFDFDADKWVIDWDDDLNAVYNLTLSAEPMVLKLWLFIRRGIRVNFDETKLDELTEKEDIVGFYAKDSDTEDSEELEWDENFNLIDYEKDRSTLLREGYIYIRHTPYKRAIRKVMTWIYTCQDKKHHNWTGKWELMPLMFNGEYGKQLVPHSISKDEHSFNYDESACKKYSKAIMSYTEGNNDIVTKQEVVKLIESLSRKDPNLTTAQIVASIKTAFPNAELLERKYMYQIIVRQRSKLAPNLDGPGMIDVRYIKTLRKTQFGRGLSFVLIDGKPKHFFYLYSDFQMQVAEEVKDDPNLHLFIDGTFKCWPRTWTQLLNVWVFHRGKNLYIPIAHILMQTERYEGYITVLNWIKETFEINPKFITTDFEQALMKSSKEVFSDSMLVPWFFHFAKALWMHAGKFGLKKKNFLCLTKQLIFSLKSLAFRPPTKVYRRFEQLKNVYICKGTCYKNYLEYFEHTWMDGIFQIKDWNYYDKIAEFEDLAMTNNGLESFHQMIRSQLRRINPSIAGFVEVLARVETLKKSDYDQDKIKGDPQYNRCWPATRIFRELYYKESKKGSKILSSSKNLGNIKDETGAKSEVKKTDHKKDNAAEDSDFDDYGNFTVEKLKKENADLYMQEVRKIEREVVFLFEQFEEEQSYQRDTIVREANKRYKEIDSKCKVKKDMPEPDEKEFGVFENYVYKDRPELMDIMEKTKYVKSKIVPPPCNKQHGLLEELEFDTEMARILKGEFSNTDYMNWSNYPHPK